MTKPPLTSAADQLKFDTYKYKIYHPAFPHESTGDQFFDRVQWESYYQLGQHIGADVLGLRCSPDKYELATAPKPSVEQLLGWFDGGQRFFEEAPAATGYVIEPIMQKEESADESFKPGGPVDAVSAPAAVPREVSPPPVAPSEAEVGYRM